MSKVSTGKNATLAAAATALTLALGISDYSNAEPTKTPNSSESFVIKGNSGVNQEKIDPNNVSNQHKVDGSAQIKWNSGSDQHKIDATANHIKIDSSAKSNQIKQGADAVVIKQ